MELICEEWGELLAACRSSNLVEVADGACDLIYVVYGLMILYGIDADAVWAEVQKSNMTKTAGIKSDAGKLLKGPNFVPPDIAGALERQKPIGFRVFEESEAA